MIKNQIVPGNKIIADFMGLTVLPSGYISRDLKRTEIQEDDLKYHSSWDSLMPVVTKIEKIKVIDQFYCTYKVSISKDSCRIFDGDCDDIEGFIKYVSYPTNTVKFTKIEATWRAVVEFIEFYQTKTKTES